MTRTFQVGDFVEVIDTDKVIKRYLKDSLFDSTLNISTLRILSKLREGDKYEVTDVCTSCQALVVKVGYKFANLRFGEILLRND